MKGAMLGGVGVCGIGAAVVGGGGSGPNDFVAVVSKPPSAVYAAFSDLGPAGDKSEFVPKRNGGSGKLTKRVVRVPNENVRFEFLIDEQPLLTAEVQLAAEGSGTRMAAEIDFDDQLLGRIMEESGAEFPAVPSFVFQEFLIDQVFAQAMKDVVERIEKGQPLLSLTDAHERWGRESSNSGTFSRSPGSSGWRQQQAVRPQMSTQPALDPDEVRQRPSAPEFDDY